MKRKIMAVLLAAAMTGSLVGCGSTQNKNAADASEEKMKVAMVTDSGDITDQSFNQMTYEACKAWGKENDIEFNYYKPQSDSDEARTASVDQAVADGANVIVLSGYVFAPTVIDESDLYPEVKFLALDVSAGDICEKGIGEGYDYNPDHYNVTDYYNEDNVYCCTYQEELSGFMAGYAAVMLGYRHLGFLGGMSVPAVNRYGYGYVQGADAAAKELGITDEVQVEYVCGGQFYGDADITAYMDTWYGSKGVEVVFACGGGIYTSAAEAAVKTGGKVIGVDSDQSATIDDYKEDLTVTSAMKGLQVTIDNVLDAILDNEWDKYVGKIENLGMESPDPAENYVQLPEETTQWDGTFTKEDYQKLVQRMYNGEYEVSSDSTTFPETEITATDYGSIK
ncbi:BMP family lipoprotein [Blautia sp. NSJ-166]|uniref:BMP family lipoprotein n=1 Tax=Blautia sp. NSJ-166 TaxID=2931882 RepID=UPI000E54F335|nr:BMP family ABC transporter substrate-binding protein [Blautia sp. NSJ-166]MCJ8046562.1 BMP family ABC transporter substrate-binding protein [Blautia sp. NSJ-166]RGF86262.1 BMP family ABC transporter substrate-binding protein [Ruminococcus sp. OF03-6AA]RGH48981.1 BMP family ABC transporter substrate-binding protein [Ruminococcus sp. AM36-5]RGH55440.1 BMP family ABC transporter substrate-binding protein [Ruminococcus sp. AM36-2AA]